MVDGAKGIPTFHAYGQYHKDIDSITLNESNSYFADVYATTLYASLEETKDLGEKLENVKISTDFRIKDDNEELVWTKIGQQLEKTAKLMILDTNKSDPVERATYFLSMDGFDTHNTISGTDLRFGQLNSVIESFRTQLIKSNLWKNVTIVTLSDFGRTLTSNGKG